MAPSGMPTLTPAELPSLGFDRVVARLAEFPLERRFPNHYDIAPSLEASASDVPPPILREFFRAGEVVRRNVPETLLACPKSEPKVDSGIEAAVRCSRTMISRSRCHQVRIR